MLNIATLIGTLTLFQAQVATPVAPADANIIPNGNFAQGNVGFTSDIPYTKPEYNCLWPGAYTLAKTFNHPLLHQLVAPEAYGAPTIQSGNDKVFFANAGGTEEMTIWATDVQCKPNTNYLIKFNCISFSGHIEDGNPPHQIATQEWVPDFVIWANNESGLPFQPGCGKYYKASMRWNSRKNTTAAIKIVRQKIPHGGGLIGISNIQMIPVAETKN